MKRVSGFAGLCAGILACVGIAIGAGVASAQSDPIAQRKTEFKAMAGAVKSPGAMLKGGEPFDAAKVKEALSTIVTQTGKLPALFPDSSKTGDTDALPAIWANKADFEARFDKLGKDAAAAIVSITDEASFKQTMPKLLGQCGGCHREYKKPS